MDNKALATIYVVAIVALAGWYVGSRFNARSAEVADLRSRLWTLEAKMNAPEHAAEAVRHAKASEAARAAYEKALASKE